ncbi:baculoviral IAP repeat-containing protein 7-B-like [Haliotis rufescens]|uniref:baculoviral IAP repeat-containing protein 7-B-like n=1 Tax=Haliotis rufescens TaxID=6454 RepID=UPI00201F7192|nr:baculoviral IAP repeat-containing protein 7-B-like [Haliotis rufescens]XP_048255811.1 baculoviral IAP repeat-containing protein 7-B-like [Haliotis rufescens]
MSDGTRRLSDFDDTLWGSAEIGENVQHRRQTYGADGHRWSGKKDKAVLARAGFTFTGIGDKVECERCGLKLLNWTDTDDALHEHATRRTHCPFIVSLYRKLGQTPPPKHPQYQHMRARLDSFADWPRRYVPKTPEELAAAGFFYIGSADRVTCFQCGITLRDWEEEHDPVAEHQRYSEHCQFINKTDLNQLGVATRTVEEKKTEHNGRTDTDRQNSVNNNHVTNTPEACSIQRTSSSTNERLRPMVGGLNFSACQILEADSSVSRSSPIQPTAGGTDSLPKTHPSVSCSTDPQASQPGREGSLVTPTSQRLVVENKRLREKSACRMCRNEAVGVLFLPCGHLVTCSGCAPTITDCIICGKTLLGTVKTFFT